MVVHLAHSSRFSYCIFVAIFKLHAETRQTDYSAAFALSHSSIQSLYLFKETETSKLNQNIHFSFVVLANWILYEMRFGTILPLAPNSLLTIESQCI